MARIFVDYISDRIIIDELTQYHAYHMAVRSGAPKSERPELPRRPKTSRSLPGMALYAAGSILLRLSEMLGMTRAQEWIANNSIRNDRHSPEPMSCSLHRAYTKYGLARLAQGDVVSAIQALSYSAKIHPCIHTTRIGLSYTLRNGLLPYAEAEDAIKLYDVIARRFCGQKLYLPREGG